MNCESKNSLTREATSEMFFSFDLPLQILFIHCAITLSQLILDLSQKSSRLWCIYELNIDERSKMMQYCVILFRYKFIWFIFMRMRIQFYYYWDFWIEYESFRYYIRYDMDSTLDIQFSNLQKVKARFIASTNYILHKSFFHKRWMKWKWWMDSLGTKSQYKYPII